MLLPSLVILIVMVTAGFVTVVAFSWAASDRQFENPEDAARSIFDEDERVGEPTDPELRKRSHH